MLIDAHNHPNWHGFNAEKILVLFQKNLLICFFDRLDCGLKHAAMTTAVRHSGVGRSPVSLGMKLI